MSDLYVIVYWGGLMFSLGLILGAHATRKRHRTEQGEDPDA